MSEWVRAIMEEIMGQLELKHRIREIDVDPILQILQQKAPTLEKDPRVNENNPWFVKCLKAAAQILYKTEQH